MSRRLKGTPSTIIDSGRKKKNKPNNCRCENSRDGHDLILVVQSGAY